MKAVELVILIGWILFWLGWLVAALRSKPGHSRWGRAMGVRVAIVIVVIVLVRVRAFHGHTLNHSAWLDGVGLALFVAGLALAVWARVHIGVNWGTPMSQKADPELVTTGPYRTIRHPIYSGIILASIGTALTVSLYWLVPTVILGGYFVYSATREERYMVRSFPEAYPEYKKSTKMLIPFIF